jgi:hypothetical protein
MCMALGALKQHTLRAHVQVRVWGRTAVPQQELLDPLESGYHSDSNDGQLKPTTTDDLYLTSTCGHRGNGKVSVQGKLLIKLLLMQVWELTMQGRLSL